MKVNGEMVCPGLPSQEDASAVEVLLYLMQIPADVLKMCHQLKVNLYHTKKL